MKNELARLTGISLCLAKIPAKWAVFFSYDSSSPVSLETKLVFYLRGILASFLWFLEK